MSPRSSLLLCVCLAIALGASPCPGVGPDFSESVVQQLRADRGFAEPHTPGSGIAGTEMAATDAVRSLLGEDPDLNRVTYVRTFLSRRSHVAEGRAAGGRRPRAVLILMPGFLGDATSLTPLAEDLVAELGGALEVWALSRRSNQLEDRRGSAHTAARIEAARSPEEVDAALDDGLAFYFPEPDGIDYNGNGVTGESTELSDARGDTRSYVQLEQDDLRYAAYWGVDTHLRDWRRLVDRARELVGPGGVVAVGGHSMGTTWTGVYAAYDFDPDPDRVDAGYASVDGLLLLEGGGPGAPSGNEPDLDSYLASVEALETPGGPDVFLDDFTGVVPATLGPAAELAGQALIHRPDEQSPVQSTPVFAGPPFNLVIQAPTTNRGVVGLFIDDDFEPFTAFRASVGFSDDFINLPIAAAPPFAPAPFYIASPKPDGLREWKSFDDPTLPRCPPNEPDVSPGCALIDNGAKDRTRFCDGGFNAGQVCTSGAECGSFGRCPFEWGEEREVTDLRRLAGTLFGPQNFVDWYFLTGRVSLDLDYGRDSSALVAEHLLVSGDEGPLVVTQNANVDVPVLAIGGSNGLTALERSFANYLGSIATPPEKQEIVLIEGYAHLDPTMATDNEAVPVIADWIRRLGRRGGRR